MLSFTRLRRTKQCRGQLKKVIRIHYRHDFNVTKEKKKRCVTGTIISVCYKSKLLYKYKNSREHIDKQCRTKILAHTKGALSIQALHAMKSRNTRCSLIKETRCFSFCCHRGLSTRHPIQLNQSGRKVTAKLEENERKCVQFLWRVFTTGGGYGGQLDLPMKSWINSVTHVADPGWAEHISY